MRREFDRLRPEFAAFCGCEICTGDVLIYALNRLPPRYVSTTAGSALTELDIEKDQFRASVDVILIEAFRRISQAPRCGRRPSAGR